MVFITGIITYECRKTTTLVLLRMLISSTYFRYSDTSCSNTNGVLTSNMAYFLSFLVEVTLFFICADLRDWNKLQLEI